MYDVIIVTHLPAFYKVRLYNEISKRLKIFVVFIGTGSVQRTSDFTEEEKHFEYLILSKAEFEERNKILTLFKIFKLLRQKSYRKLLLSGWDLPEYWFLAFCNPKNKLALAVESTLIESKANGLKGSLKKLFLSRISFVLASGTLHKKLLEAFNFKGEVALTKGVGLIKKLAQNTIPKSYEKKFLFLGRLSPEKNLLKVVEVFNNLPEYQLTIIGDGPQKEEILKSASSNIILLRHVPNDQISMYIKNHDFLLLPSISEPWGLVIEEALYYGRPVIISNHCGSTELIQESKNGYIFNPEDAKELENLILSIDDNTYQNLLRNIAPDFIDSKDAEQVKAYYQLI